MSSKYPNRQEIKNRKKIVKKKIRKENRKNIKIIKKLKIRKKNWICLPIIFSSFCFPFSNHKRTKIRFTMRHVISDRMADFFERKQITDN